MPDMRKVKIAFGICITAAVHIMMGCPPRISFERMVHDTDLQAAR
jgi:hypothetical protein